MRRGNPEYDPDDDGRWKAMADDPDYVQDSETDWQAYKGSRLRSRFRSGPTLRRL